MPIKPENLKRYPPDWKQIRAEVLERAGHRCEGSPDFPDCRAANGELHPETSSRVVLTIAHLDHVPENVGEAGSRANLKAWCQRCHLHYDHEHHQKNARHTRRNGKAIGELFTTVILNPAGAWPFPSEKK